jgi:phosphoglycerate kinase
MKKIQDVHNLKERKVVVRVDFNVPLGKNKGVDSDSAFRIEKSLETINFLKNAGAKVIIISHIGRDKKETLKPIADYVNNIVPLKFIPTLDPESVLSIINQMVPSDVVMLENLRQNSGEESNDLKFANFLANLGDMFVNEAFACSHRSHASIVGVPMYMESYAGFWFQKEVENLSKFLQKPETPFVFILGGAKFETKINLIEKFETIATQIFIGGALANNFFKEIGFEVGKSLIDPKENVRRFFHKERISIPFDVRVEPGEEKELGKISKDDTIIDIGEETAREWAQVIMGAKTVLWNGPLGRGEHDSGSRTLLEAMTTSKAFSVVGGGDTVQLVRRMGVEDKISFVSTAGGAMLEYLAKGTLPGIEALSQ